MVCPPPAHARDLLGKEDPMNQQAQWTAEIAVNAPLKTVWEVANDVTLIPRYHPEVDTVDVIAGQARRTVGTKYQCNILEGRGVALKKCSLTSPSVWS